MQQAEDFREESRALAELLAPLGEGDFVQPTLFKGWTVDDVLGHLHLFNVAAARTLQGAEDFGRFLAPVLQRLQDGSTLLQAQRPWLDGLAGRALYDAWREGAERLADDYAGADPKRRVAWAGPEMSTLSCITARQMETWAHGQALFDLLGVDRVEHDRIRNVAHLGVSTFGWSFANRRLPVPQPAPHVRLIAPSGAVWTWNEPSAEHAVLGSAVDFARVVTQVRAVADTRLEVIGSTAQRWMALAQCFAGPPVDPPAPGTRRRAERRAAAD